MTNKAVKINLLDFKSPQMRAFHMSWFAFCLCFISWFGIAPLMTVVREELQLTKAQIGNTIIASVAVTIFARLLIGRLCDKFGPRLCYTALLIFGSIPVMCIGLADSYSSFLLFRLAIGVIGASFVITQYHTTLMFAPNVVGTANATTAGWGNLGGGLTQIIMPLLFTGIIAFGFTEASSWRIAMVIAGCVCFIVGIAYFFLTQDTPEGNFKDIKRDEGVKEKKSSIFNISKDYRVWILFLVYGGCFGIELTMNNIAAMYFFDNFKLDLKTAGLIAGLFGLMNLFARSLGGIIGDKFGIRWGLKGRVRWLMIALLVEACALTLFSRMDQLAFAIGALIIFSLFVQMSEGATYSVVPFINKKGIGLVSGIVGAGGNLGAVSAGFLFKGAFEWSDALLILGGVVFFIALTVPFIKFSAAEENETRVEIDTALKTREELEAKLAIG